jgi:hypothetical protein
VWAAEAKLKQEHGERRRKKTEFGRCQKRAEIAAGQQRRPRRRLLSRLRELASGKLGIQRQMRTGIPFSQME